MRIEQLTFTRFLAAIPIVLFHYSREIFPFNTPALNFWVVNANMGVSYFFILSGFVMAIAYGNRHRDTAESHHYQYGYKATIFLKKVLTPPKDVVNMKAICFLKVPLHLNEV